MSSDDRVQRAAEEAVRQAGIPGGAVVFVPERSGNGTEEGAGLENAGAAETSPPPFVQAAPAPCCALDNDGDGNCPTHPEGVKHRVATVDVKTFGRKTWCGLESMGPKASGFMLSDSWEEVTCEGCIGNRPKRTQLGEVKKLGATKTREAGVVVLDVDGQLVRFDLTLKAGAELTAKDKEELIAFARKIRTEQGAKAEKGEEFAGTLHRCHARGCDRHVAPKFLMCPGHWRKVPVTIQQRVLKAYRMGQERTKKPSRAYVEAAGEAIAAVARLEGR